MSQLGVQLVIGRLLTDEQFRRRFEQGRRECLRAVCDSGLNLDEDELTALVEGDAAVWDRMASRIDHRLRNRVPRRTRSRYRVTAREHTVLRGVFDGLTNKQIAEDLHVSESAVKATLQQLFRKTQVRTRAQLVRVALEAGVVPTKRSR